MYFATVVVTDEKVPGLAEYVGVQVDSVAGKEEENIPSIKEATSLKSAVAARIGSAYAIIFYVGSCGEFIKSLAVKAISGTPPKL